ncbi:NADH-quinone oxidoreductase subunit J family protein [Aureibacter tunicatorum]|uniref:NADH-quinone oxidoreductase subunit J n=1 Tax=Aureibacter tunicatorum TaxID=866807 RepID=A0AAE4BQZ3_9BACT|nr:NADH-quinone oxidoreductase subunit J [Aureibacter tunicatorum]MDR6239694.1 NADH-quinone oxidoreductase subunit J [Aureibacter tunicatorum]BDD04170.1 NADH-quinone oxidoreductase subunit J [Aureibacter tunicatorum]
MEQIIVEGSLNALFYVFAGLSLVTALGIMLIRNVLYGAFLLVFSLLAISGLYVLLGADFVAVTQIMIYVGGVLVLMVFGIMLTNRLDGQKILTENRNVLMGGLVGVGMFALLCYLIKGMDFGQKYIATDKVLMEDQSLKEIGVSLMSEYVLPFEFVGVILLVILIAASYIASNSKFSK